MAIFNKYLVKLFLLVFSRWRQGWRATSSSQVSRARNRKGPESGLSQVSFSTSSLLVKAIKAGQEVENLAICCLSGFDSRWCPADLEREEGALASLGERWWLLPGTCSVSLRLSFIGHKSDHSLPLSVTNSLTDWSFGDLNDVTLVKSDANRLKMSQQL